MASVAPKPPPTASKPGDAPASTNAPSGAHGVPKKNPKEMTKAERRELQERQRAAKAANVAAGGKGQPKGSGKDGQASQGGKKASSGADTSAGGRVAHGQGSGPSTPHRQTRDSVHGQQTSQSQQAQSQQTQTRGPRIFSHFGLTKPPSNVKGDAQIHPAVLRVGLQFAAFKIVGANARCIATLTALKNVIQDYQTPPHTTLARHLTHHISPQISHIVAARPMGVSMGAAIRQLKLEISGVDIDLPEQDAKDLLCSNIDTYIRERIIVADQVIAEAAVDKINDGDLILTFARSSIVEKVILHAHSIGKRISVIIADSRPLLEGKALLHSLTAAGLRCTYVLLPSLGAVLSSLSSSHSTSSPTSTRDSLASQAPTPVPTPGNAPVPSTGPTYTAPLASTQLDAPPSPVTPTTPQTTPVPTPAASGKIITLLGAHALHADGCVTSRAGTALVALLAKTRGIPVLVCCETCKFSGGVLLDGFAKNELAPPSVLAPFPPSIPRKSLVIAGSPEPTANLEILSPLYDLTPARNVTAVVTEVGIVPPSSVGALQSQNVMGVS